MTSSISRRVLLGGAGLGALAALGACTDDSSGTDSDQKTSKGSSGLTRQDGVIAVRLGDDPALALSRAALTAAGTVAVARSAEPADLDQLAAAATEVKIPLLVVGPELAAELDRLKTERVLALSSDGLSVGDRDIVTLEDGKAPSIDGLPADPPAGQVLALQLPDAKSAKVLAPTLAALGAQTIAAPGDPRRSIEATKALRDAKDATVIALGSSFGDQDRLSTRVETCRTVDELPGGGVLPFPDRMMIALYGHPEAAALGMLGEQPAEEAVERVKALVKEYDPLVETPVVPAFEIIATVASQGAESDGSYSRRTAIDTLLPWIEAAEKGGVYIVIDLQPGRMSFLDQAKEYEDLLKRPWVGLALDPEWRLKPDQVHLKQIGSVDTEEINEVSAWLSELVTKHSLPPKVLTLHQFRTDMIRRRERLDVSHDNIQILVHVDGQGGQGEKQSTWSAIRKGLPKEVFLGWKNFEDEDSPMLTPKQTIDQVSPTPSFISYQ
ncbi:hypothetical protein [Janibacter sp. GXQ6167]|uniref:hypothetical protein n=1 Tax=Janibacter sp. GXQ6167 TaxID=3240791 RepID=UPI003524BAB6